MKTRYIAWILLAVVPFFISGCIGPGYPPNEQIMDPRMVFDSFGNIITAFQMNAGNGPLTYIKKIGQDGKELWFNTLDSRQPEMQTRKDPRPSYTELIDAGNGEVVIVWNYQSQIYITKLDVNGQPVWKDKFIKVGEIKNYRLRRTFKSPEGFTVVWVDSKNNLNVQTVDTSGNLLLSSGGFIKNVLVFSAICDDEGKIWLVWDQSLDKVVHILKMNAHGQSEWPNAITLSPELSDKSTPLSYSEYSFWVNEDDSGNIIVCWANNWMGDGLNLNKLDSQGNILWNKENLHVGKSFGSEYRIADDGAGGIFVYWDYGPSTYGQHIVAGGQAVWDENGTEIIRDNGGGIVDACPDGSDGTVIIWKNNYLFYAQHIDSNGTKLWDDDGIIVSDKFSSYMNSGEHAWSHTNPMVISNNAGSFFVSYGVLTSHSLIQKIDEDGTLPWGLTGLNLR